MRICSQCSDILVPGEMMAISVVDSTGCQSDGSDSTISAHQIVEHRSNFRSKHLLKGAILTNCRVYEQTVSGLMLF
jgi:hypothetical protein